MAVIGSSGEPVEKRVPSGINLKNRASDPKAKQTAGAKGNPCDVSKVLIKAIGPYVQCNICSRLCSRQGHIKCAECTEFYICVKCFCSGLEKPDDDATSTSFVPSANTIAPKNSHRNNHKYMPVGPANFALFTKDWSAEQELLLVDSIAKYGLGNWMEISEMVSMASSGYKSWDECQSHYYKIYLNSATSPLPDLTSLVTNADGTPIIVAPNRHRLVPEESKQISSNKPPMKPHVIGYWPLRGDFDIEYDNDAELILADMEFRPEDTPEQIELKLQVLEIYNSKIDERIYRKKIIISRGLLDAKALQQKERKWTAEEKELYNALRPFLRFQTNEEHDHTVQLLIKERKLRTKLYQLMLWKVLGLENPKEIAEFEERMDRVEGYKEALLRQQADVSRRIERRLRVSNIDNENTNTSSNTKLKITDFMDEKEIEFCSSLQLPPIAYFLAKRVLLHELASNPMYTVDDMCNELRIDGVKQGRIFDFLLLLTPKSFQNINHQVCDLTKATLNNHGFIDTENVASEISLTSNTTNPIHNKFVCNKITSYFGVRGSDERPQKIQKL
ncbi:bifunctional Homeobox-like domain superfamily/SANT-Myb domain/Zinc finger [Babesia duncani]|uniref:Bifunctional Homeobox-like domain superfamily/SANT-Myb domain/Zinc finger n=1 Tax=Babesia duncani TaxID=323732 RepID=A0AAD9PJ42_9APIC|nr:bifunctional Homeobox-like domain superfamily/SANT-Myb domain/Zinc finger [Babesia duncani]